MNKDLMFSSDSGEWDTPKDLIDDLSTVFKWDLDTCASHPNVCNNYYSFDKGQNALELPWERLWYCNFPYGRGSMEWIKKGIGEVNKYGGTGVFLSPARTDTRATQHLMRNASMVVFISGRLVFGSDESWIERHEKTILGTTPIPGIKKLGGRLASDNTIEYVSEIWDLLSLNFSFDDWMSMEYLKKDAAPFPSMFAVVGEINKAQKDKLASYGVSVIIE